MMRAFRLGPLCASLRGPLCGAAILAAALGGCAPRDEEALAAFRIYAGAFADVAAASAPLIDAVAAAERAEEGAAIDRGETVAGVAAETSGADVAVELRVAHAPYFARSGDPPLASAMRLGIGAVARYNAALAALAEGRDAVAVKGEIAPLLRLASGPAGSPAAFGSVAQSAAQSLSKGLVAVLAAQGRDELRERLLARAEEIEALLDALREAGSRAFFLLAQNDLEALELALALADADETALHRAKVNAARERVADWIVALGAAKAALADARATAMSPQDGGAALMAATWAAEIGAGALRLRTAATLR